MGTELHITPLPYELRIGVSGHRKLPDSVGVEKAMRGVLDHIGRTLESASLNPFGECGPCCTWLERFDRALVRLARSVWPAIPLSAHQTPEDRRTPLQWTVISSLAKGADRIVPRAVLDRPGARLQAILPFVADDYRRDFVEPDDLREFNELLARDPAPTILPNDYGAPGNGDSEAEEKAKQDLRNEGYLDGGRQVAEACEILIVIWNGKLAAGRGGTGDVVDYALAHGRSVIWINSDSPSDAPRWLERRPADNGNADAISFIELPLPTTAKELSPTFHQIAAYNRGAAFSEQDAEQSYNDLKNHLHTNAQRAGLPDSALAGVVEHLLPQYAKADQMAARYQSLHNAGAIGIHCLSASAVTIAVAQLLFFQHMRWLITLEVIAMVCALLLLRINRTEAWHEKWLHNRHLAERLRAACYTLLMTRSTDVGENPSIPLPFYRGHGEWVAKCCEYLMENCKRAIQPVDNLAPLRGFLISAWLVNQADYHKHNADRRHRSVVRSRIIGTALFGITLLMALLHLVLPHAERHGDALALAWLGMAMIVALSIVLPAWGGASQAINSLLERERIMGRSRQMAAALHEIARQAAGATTIEQLSVAVERAHRVMATENQEWMVSLSFRGLELPG